MTSVGATMGPVAKAILRRVGLARAEHLTRHGADLIWAEIGRQMGWIQATTSNVKLGKRPVDLEEVPRLAEILGVRVAWLFTGEGPMVEGDSVSPIPGVPMSTGRQVIGPAGEDLRPPPPDEGEDQSDPPGSASSGGARGPRRPRGGGLR